MYILAARFNGMDTVQFYVATNRRVLKPIMADAIDWRLWNAGWIEGKTPESWKVAQSVAGEMMRYVI